MGKMLGAFAPDNDLDRPDLNKCPDCGCFFAQNNCPLCGKECPEEMRAGNRKPVKQPKRRARTSDRVTFVEWYHSWWFMIIMMFIFPLVGIILLATSPHKRSLKIAFIAGVVLYTLLVTFGLGFIIIDKITGIWNKPVDTSLDRTEYVEACEEVTPESFYRNAGSYEGEFITLTLTVKQKVSDYYGDDEYTTYYICEDESGRFDIMVRDCIQDSSQNFISGDVITVYGEGAGNCYVWDGSRDHDLPCIYVAYVSVE